MYNNQRKQKLIKDATKAETVAIDTETTGLDYIDSELVGISLSFKAGEGFYIPIGHKDDSTPQLAIDYVLAELKQLLESNDKKFIGQNIKFDKNVLSKYGNISSIKNDTMMILFLMLPLQDITSMLWPLFI